MAGSSRHRSPVVRPALSAARGFTLVELLVGMALGLMLVAAAGTFVAGPLQAQRRTQAEARLMQELRAAADVLTRDLRRAGHWHGAAAAAANRASGQPSMANPYADLQAGADGAAATVTTYAYAHDAAAAGPADGPQPGEQFGIRINARTHAIDLRVSGSHPARGTGERWQQLTDPRSVRVTRLEVRLGQQRIALPEACAGSPCGGGSVDCPVHAVVREFTVVLAGHDPRDPTLQRDLSTRVRVRNDAVEGRCPA